MMIKYPNEYIFSKWAEVCFFSLFAEVNSKFIGNVLEVKVSRREIQRLDLHQGGKKGVFPPQHVFANIFVNSYSYVLIFLRA